VGQLKAELQQQETLVVEKRAEIDRMLEERDELEDKMEDLRLDLETARLSGSSMVFSNNTLYDDEDNEMEVQQLRAEVMALREQLDRQQAVSSNIEPSNVSSREARLETEVEELKSSHSAMEQSYEEQMRILIATSESKQREIEDSYKGEIEALSKKLESNNDDRASELAAEVTSITAAKLVLEKVGRQINCLLKSRKTDTLTYYMTAFLFP